MLPRTTTQPAATSRRLDGTRTRRRAPAVVGAAVVACGLILGVSGAHRTEMVPVATSLSSADATAVVALLEASDVQHELADGGTTVMVPRGSVEAARAEVAAAGLPKDAQAGYALLDDRGVTVQHYASGLAAEG